MSSEEALAEMKAFLPYGTAIVIQRLISNIRIQEWHDAALEKIEEHERWQLWANEEIIAMRTVISDSRSRLVLADRLSEAVKAKEVMVAHNLGPDEMKAWLIDYDAKCEAVAAALAAYTNPAASVGEGKVC